MAGVNAGALVGKTITQAAMVTTGVTPGKKLRAGGAVNVGYNVRGKANATALLAMRGPAHLVNNPTKPHRINPRTRSGRRRSSTGARALRFDDGRFARSANHPGTPGKKFWQKAEAVIERKVPDVVFAAHRGSWLREFSGG